jgi:hypothetical protein
MKGASQMNLTSSALIVAILIALCVVGGGAQEQSATDVKPDRTVGAAEVYYLKDKNKSRAQVILHPLGDPNDRSGERDALRIDVIFETEGLKVVKPRYVFFAFSSYSPKGPKYQKDRDLTIYTRDIKGFTSTTARTRMLSSSSRPSGGAVEIFVSSAIPYSRFLEILAALDTTISVGETQFKLTKEDVKALNDLNQTIEQ